MKPVVKFMWNTRKGRQHRGSNHFISFKIYRLRRLVVLIVSAKYTMLDFVFLLSLCSGQMPPLLPIDIFSFSLNCLYLRLLYHSNRVFTMDLFHCLTCFLIFLFRTVKYDLCTFYIFQSFSIDLHIKSQVNMESDRE